jgi:hypothetical protein
MKYDTVYETFIEQIASLREGGFSFYIYVMLLYGGMSVGDFIR